LTIQQRLPMETLNNGGKEKEIVQDIETVVEMKLLD